MQTGTFEHFPICISPGECSEADIKDLARAGWSIPLHCASGTKIWSAGSGTKILILCTKGCIIIPFQPPRRRPDCSDPISNDTNVCITTHLHFYRLNIDFCILKISNPSYYPIIFLSQSIGYF